MIIPVVFGHDGAKVVVIDVAAFVVLVLRVLDHILRQIEAEGLEGDLELL